MTVRNMAGNTDATPASVECPVATMIEAKNMAQLAMLPRNNRTAIGTNATEGTLIAPYGHRGTRKQTVSTAQRNRSSQVPMKNAREERP